MSFESAYENYKNGTATDEEIAFVEEEIEKAKRLNAIIDELDNKKGIIAPTGKDEVQKAKALYVKKSALRTAIISMMVVIVAVGIACAIVFGSAASAAKKAQKYTQEQAEQIAVQFVQDNYTVADGAVIVTERKRSLHIDSPLKSSTYYYEIEVQNGASMEVDLQVDAHTGLVKLIEIDRD